MDWNSKQVKCSVNRSVSTHDVAFKRTGYKKNYAGNIRNYKKVCITTVQQLIPIIEWLPKYSIRNNIIGDLVAGLTVAIMHIPHGLAYGVLAGLGPSNGLYMAIFPVLVYLIFGTSRHISIGTFAVVSLMTLKVVSKHEDNSVLEPDAIIYTNLEVVTALTFSVGIIHFSMACFRLGILSSLLSEAVVGGFTTGAALHVVTTLMKDVLGVPVARHVGALKIINTVNELVEKSPETNSVTFALSLLAMIFLTIMNEMIKPWLKTKCRHPFPAELFVICGATLISRVLEINKFYGVILVGDIPKEMPSPKLPPVELLPLVLSDAIAIAIVSYTVVMSLGLAFANKHLYEIRPNQELLAMALGNLVGSCFACIPLACSLSRSLVQEQIGGVTQITSLFSSMLILMTLLWIGQFFSVTPKCVLAAVIIVSLKPMFMQVKKLKIFAQHGNLECITWVITFFCVALIDIDIGLFIGMTVSFVTYIRTLKPYSVVLGIVPGYDAVYVELRNHANAIEVVQTKIFRYYGSLNFATRSHFRTLLYKAIAVNKAETTSSTSDLLRSLVLDFSSLSYIDGSGCRQLSEIINEMSSFEVGVFIANPSDRVYELLVLSMSHGLGPFEVFPTLHDAVSVAIANAVA